MKRFSVWVATAAIIAAAFAPAASASNNASTRADVIAPHVAHELVVKFQPGLAASERSAVAAQHGGTLVRRVEALDVDVLEFGALKANPSAKALENLLVAFKRNPNVVYAERNNIYTVNWTPNDPGYSSQWGWPKIQANTAWDTTQGSTATVVAIVDTGIQRNHPDLDSKIVAGYDFVSNDTLADDGNGHGTHVAGTVAAETNNSTAGAGGCPNCKLMPVRVLDNNGSGTMDGVANGITWAADNGAKVINMSLGGGGATTLQNAVSYAYNTKGVFLACAAGNDNTSSTTNAYPGAYTQCFAVASTTETDARSSFSNYGSWVEVAAPGSNIYSTWINSGTNTINGTSMATPHVAGLAGLLSGQGLSASQIWTRIYDTADDIAGTGTYWTGGRINYWRAVTNTPPGGGGGGGTALTNGNFESGTSPWVQTSSGGYQLIDTTRPHAGSYGVYALDYSNATETIAQTVLVPANGTLKYWWYMTSSESTTTAYDYMYVRVYNTSGGLLATLRTRSNTAARNAWYQDSLSMSAYAGQTVKIEFRFTSDASVNTGFFIDDVTL